jgi:hypothetical protein
MKDQLILDRGDVRVSRSVIRFGNTTYPVRVLRSVRVDLPSQPTGRIGLGIILICIAVFLAVALGFAVLESKEFSNNAKIFGVFVLGLASVGVQIWSTARPGPYSLVFRMSGRDVQARDVRAYVSFDRDDIFEIKEAIESALSTAMFVGEPPGNAKGD